MDGPVVFCGVVGEGAGGGEALVEALFETVDFVGGVGEVVAWSGVGGLAGQTMLVGNGTVKPTI